MKRTTHQVLLELTHNQVLSPKTGMLCFAAAAASVNNLKATEHAVRYSLNHELVRSEELYEALLQTYLFAGFPAALESLSILYNYVQNKHSNPISFHLYPVDEYRMRGESLCAEIYTNVYEKMRRKLGKISPDLDQWMIIEGYGKTLSRPGLETKVRELLSATSLAAMGWENQCYSHVRGALNVGATQEECRALLPIIRHLSSVRRSNMAQQIIDNVLETLS